MASLNELRQRLASTPDCSIVSANEFTDMMISRSSFSRADEPDAMLLGLIDESTGMRVLVKAEDLQKMQRQDIRMN